VLIGLPAGVLYVFLSRSRRPTSVADAGFRMLVILGYSGLAALLVAVLAGPLLGYYSGNLLTLWGWGTLLCAAAMAAVVALGAWLGVAGVLVGLVVILFFGLPGSPVPVPWNFESTVYRVLGPLVPTGSAVDAMRNDIYFGAASLAKNIEVLVAWIAIPALILVAIGWWVHRTAAASAEPAVTPAPTPSSMASVDGVEERDSG
jgi:hypothetical protein